MSKNDRILRALKRQPVDSTPLWIMRQAGRYLPEYRKIREQAGSFMALCQNPELACEVTLQPLRRFELDAAIIFSDILTIPDALGLELFFTEGEGPKFKYPVQDIKAIKSLIIPDISEKLSYVFSAIKLVKKELNNKIPLIGFCGSPWTMATYMVEGGSSKTFEIIKKMLNEEPAALHQLLNLLSNCAALYLIEQIKAGADVLMVFDTWGGMLEQNYLSFSLFYMQEIVKKIKAYSHTPIILFSKNAHYYLENMADTGCDGLGLDWTINIKEARERVGNKVALQGNLDPAILLTSPENIRAQAQTILEDFGSYPGHIFNLGHGITPEVPIEHVQALIEAVHDYKN